MAHKYLTRHLTSLINEMKIKAAMSYHLTPIPMLIIKCKSYPLSARMASKGRLLSGGIWVWPVDSRMEISEEIKNMVWYGPATLLWVIAKGKENRISETSKHITCVESTKTKLRETDARAVVTRPGGKQEILVKGTNSQLQDKYVPGI